MAGEGKLSGRLRAGCKRGACRGRDSLRPVPASPAGRLWHASRRRPVAPPPPAIPAGARGMFTPRPAQGPAPCPDPSPGPALFGGDLTPPPRLRAPLPITPGQNPGLSSRLPPIPTRHLQAVDVHFQLQLFHSLAGLRDLCHVVRHGCGGEGVKGQAGVGQARDKSGSPGKGGGGVVAPSTSGVRGRGWWSYRKPGKSAGMESRTDGGPSGSGRDGQRGVRKAGGKHRFDAERQVVGGTEGQGHRCWSRIQVSLAPRDRA